MLYDSRKYGILECLGSTSEPDLPAFARDMVAAAVFLDRAAALGAELGVGSHPVTVLAVSFDLRLPLCPPARPLGQIDACPSARHRRCLGHCLGYGGE